MNDATTRFIGRITQTIQGMVERGYVPLVLVAMNKDTGNVIAQSIDPEVCGPDMMRTLLCRVVVGDIAPEALEEPK